MACFFGKTSANNTINIDHYSNTSHAVEHKKTTAYFLGKGFKNDMHLAVNETNLKKGIVKPKEITVSCYPKIEMLRERFNFKDNGFQFCTLSDELKKSAELFAYTREEVGSDLLFSKSAIEFITLWAKENNIPFKAIIALGTNYRDEDSRNEHTMKPFPIAHADFEKRSMANTLKTAGWEWKSKIEAALGSMTEEDYLNLPIKLMVNLWMPLNKDPTKNRLILVNKGSINTENSLRPFTSFAANSTNRPFKSLSVHYDKKQEFVALDPMSFDDSVIFNSTETIHFAANLPEVPGVKYDRFRRSLETRFIFV